MKIDIDLIKVDEASRIRQDTGNISKLQESIREVGLINPILVDEQYRLIAGYRRLCACRNLKWKDVEVRVVELENDELKMLEAEAAENMYRIDFTPEEILAIHQRRQQIIESRRPKGFFERFWNWLKSLFSSTPRPSAETAAKGKPEPQPQPIAKSSGRESGEGPEKPEQREPEPSKSEPREPEQPKSETPEPGPPKASSGETEQPEAKADPEPAAEKKPDAPTHIPKQPKSAEIVEENGMRHIKWR